MCLSSSLELTGAECEGAEDQARVRALQFSGFYPASGATPLLCNGFLGQVRIDQFSGFTSLITPL